MKHFPGLAFATRNTDAYAVTIGMSRLRLAPGLKPYRTAIGHHIPMIMLSNATYSAYDRVNAAGWSRAISTTLLRGATRLQGRDDHRLAHGDGEGAGVPPSSLAFRAARAGTDMILLTGSEASTRGVFASLLTRVANGSLSRATLQASYARIVAMKAGL